MPYSRGRTALEVSSQEEGILRSWLRAESTAQRLALRARIVLACRDGSTNQEIAEQLGVSRLTVGRWRRRFEASRLDGLADAPRSGRPRSIDDAKVAEVIERTLASVPRDASPWSVRSLAPDVGIIRSSVPRI